MKKYLVIFMIFSLQILFSQDLEYAKRLLKLANTNVWLEKYDEASQLVDEAKKILSKFNSWESKYWTAVADETLGHIYFQMGNYDFAEKYYLEANTKFKELISSTYKGSQYATKELIEQSKEIGTVKKGQKELSQNKKIVNLSYSNVTGFLNLPQDLESFVAENSNLNKFPAELYGKKNLKILVLSNNRLNDAVLREMPNLEYLDLSNNNLSNVQFDLATTKNLKFVNLSSNRLKKVPIELISMKDLKLVDLRNNQIPFSEIANLIQNLPNTTILFDRYEKVEEEEE
ncbi:hypothetical protein D9V84_07660 [Bacteroidetes/Chlorobi group bacterium Naka2016]|jgi:Leucine-rich repeat (LRR) protein|nr:MAG: hypothetical protein D9V84_07660 [Bacteroidetes/Chlorobi group bacterium Naka2016]